jgi:hypothetical protein
MKLNESSGETDQSFWLLRRYMRQHELPSPLVTRILRFLEYKIKMLEKTVPESRVSGILSLLSDNLYNELKFEADFLVVRGHPLLEHAEGQSTVLIQSMVAGQAPRPAVLTLKYYSEDDIVFTDQANDNFMHFIRSGDMRYIREEPEEKTQNMGEGDWLCEAVIWVPWLTQGTLEAVNESSVVSLEARLFVEIVKYDMQLFDLMCNYATAFADWLSSLTSERISDLSSSQSTKRILDIAVSNSADHDHGDSQEDD